MKGIRVDGLGLMKNVPRMKKAFGLVWFNSLFRKVAKAIALTSRLIVESGITVFAGSQCFD
jgi:hypothetical protein